MTDPAEKHHWRCWCQYCDIGVTATPKPPSFWERFVAAVRAVLQEKG
jgi:hypothetical protein